MVQDLERDPKELVWVEAEAVCLLQPGDSQGQNLALTILLVPSSLGSTFRCGAGAGARAFNTRLIPIQGGASISSRIRNRGEGTRLDMGRDLERDPEELVGVEAEAVCIFQPGELVSALKSSVSAILSVFLPFITQGKSGNHSFACL